MQFCILEMMEFIHLFVETYRWAASFHMWVRWWACCVFCLGICVWKAKTNSVGNSSTMIVESQTTKPEPVVYPPDTGPGRSFRNFRFDVRPILQALEAVFSSWRPKFFLWSCSGSGSWVSLHHFTCIIKHIDHPSPALGIAKTGVYVCGRFQASLVCIFCTAVLFWQRCALHFNRLWYL